MPPDPHHRSASLLTAPWSRHPLGEIPHAPGNTTLFHVRSPGRGLIEITREVRAWVAAQGLRAGLLTIFCRHTSASLLIQENAAPEVRSDIEAFFEELAPEDASRYAHDDEGADDMPAHLRTARQQCPRCFTSTAVDDVRRVGQPSSVGSPVDLSLGQAKHMRVVLQGCAAWMPESRAGAPEKR